MTQILVPVSYHLRNFNKYAKLDMQAAKNGNLTLIGENAVGKTTLANCFFPMLIDGAITTPSFNPAKNTEKMSQSTSARNSSRDTRTFESMLLGWGPGAMKVRTGYSYVLLLSDQRQVVLGLGATRVQDDPHKPTWWFVVISNETQTPIVLQTTDNKGRSLDKLGFKDANAALGDQLHVFERPEDYREFVATRVYGFSDGKVLGRLANAYRLLASPTLTSGNEKFAPILAALKDAQEGIDPMVIHRVADSQRQVNFYRGLLKRIGEGQRRLKRMKSRIFWHNLNHLQEILLTPYSRLFASNAADRENLIHTEQEVAAYKAQLGDLNQALVEVTTLLEQLRDEKAEQDQLIKRRTQYDEQIAMLQKELDDYQTTQAKIKKLQAKLAELVAQHDALTQQLNAHLQTQLAPIKVQLLARTSELNDFSNVMQADAWEEIQTRLSHYLHQLSAAKVQYDGLEETMNRLSADIEITKQMQTKMGDAIDTRVQGFGSGRVHDGLQQDNQTIHEAGAAQMNKQYQPLLDQQTAILAKHPDLKMILKNVTILPQLTAIQKQLKPLIKTLSKLQAELRANEGQQSAQQATLDAVKGTVDLDFDAESLQAKITRSKAERAALKIDPDLPKRLSATATKQQKLNQQVQSVESEINQRQGTIHVLTANIKSATTRLEECAADGASKLKTLKPYFPEDVQLKDIDELLVFAHGNRSRIRSSSFGDISEQIGRLIHRHDGQGEDRNALDVLFAERGFPAEASAMRQQRSTSNNGLTVVAFDINDAMRLLREDYAGVEKALAEEKSGNDMAYTTFVQAAVAAISAQYHVMTTYNEILAQGASHQHIKLKVRLSPVEGIAPEAITEACDSQRQQRPHLEALVKQRLEQLANNTEVSDDDDAFFAAAENLLDTRKWSDFQVLIRRRQSGENDFEVVDDKFVQSGGSGAEKAQAMVLPLLLVPKMVLQRSKLRDAPHLVMFDEFADKLDPETAKSFAKTIVNFGFSFIATMPSGAQNKLLADGVDNIVWDVMGSPQQGDGKFHLNRVQQNFIWKKDT
ncbi:SbcC/MukB-like Walker B domain-containing protein [Lacticaseibacillus rhamnosus]|uniref:SbcC/MukB-like Walker B domain-containing protein n=1 Tax=Lacticaseibacillus rhamnosus TaxID=47715 RepID=UPI0023E337F2|nr:SbcC/MukB-like Walker B domain-containing protein [Lacticaseibacillus rhamnosus]MDF3334545.1 SbcC/MukB-like Walker B domain-containing protein [Lacticaseibacillus rhamnosus]